MLRDKKFEDYNRDPFKVAAERGLECLLIPKEVIALDIDGAAWTGWDRLSLLRELMILDPAEDETAGKLLVTISPSGTGNHVYLKTHLRTYSDLEKITVQAALGSDYKRELLNLARTFKGEKADRPNLVMFETSEEAGRVRGWFARLGLVEPVWAGMNKLADSNSMILTENDVPF